MKWLKALLGNLWKWYFIFMVVITLIILYPIYLVVLIQKKYFHLGFRLIRLQVKFILLMVGVRYEIIGKIPKDGRAYIFCPNHSSYLDILILYAAIPNYFLFLGKKELGKVPMFNIYFKRLNILIDRGNPKASMQTMQEVRNRVLEGASVVIFPEGTISKTAPEMRPFKNGAFKLAIDEEIPILPICFPDNVKHLQDRWDFWAISKPGKVRMLIQEPVEVRASDWELLSLREHIKELIETKLNEC